MKEKEEVVIKKEKQKSVGVIRKSLKNKCTTCISLTMMFLDFQGFICCGSVIITCDPGKL
jgi:hypothetical protein